MTNIATNYWVCKRYYKYRQFGLYDEMELQIMYYSNQMENKRSSVL